jgi:hypothetical protein
VCLIVVGPESLVGGSAFRGPTRRGEKETHSARSECGYHVADFLVWRSSTGIAGVHGHHVSLRREDLVSDLSKFLKVSRSLLPHSLLELMKSGSALMFAMALELGQELL